MPLMKPFSGAVIVRPDSHDVIRIEAEKLMQRARAFGIYPTPVNALLEAASITEIGQIDELKESFLKKLSAEMRTAFRSGWAKLRGAADLKKRAVFVKNDQVPVRKTWATLHEIGHEILPWQKVGAGYIDDDATLSPDCEERFEREANACAAELLFQGRNFGPMAMSYRPDFSSILSMANYHGASGHATAKRFAEECSEPMAVIVYYPAKYVQDEGGARLFTLGKGASASEKFLRKMDSLALPGIISENHQWASCISSREPVSGTDTFDFGDGFSQRLMWESWWNRYSILVLLREPPKLRVLRDLIKF